MAHSSGENIFLSSPSFVALSRPGFVEEEVRGGTRFTSFPLPIQSSLAKREFSLGRRTATDIVWTAARRPPFVPPSPFSPGR